MLVQLPPDLAAVAGCAEVDVREDDNGYPEVYSGETRLTRFSIADLGRIQALVKPVERAPEPWTPGTPLKRGQKRPRECAPKPATAPVIGGRSWGTLSAHRGSR